MYISAVDRKRLSATFETPASRIVAYKALIQKHSASLSKAFGPRKAITPLIHSRAGMVDEVLNAAWAQFLPSDNPNLALVAVGGYGRGELHPCSDVDIMLLVNGDDELYREGLEGFLTFLWDIGLEIGHSVRSVEECATEAAADLTVITNVMEARLLTGGASLYQEMREAISPAKIWPAAEFFGGKFAEQKKRYERYDGSAYKVEPNLKEGPGGLRDIQMVSWVAKRQTGSDTMRGLVGHGMLTEEEYTQLLDGQEFLWRVRFAMHDMLGRREDRLLFDHQVALAEKLGYKNTTGALAVESFMQRYYRCILRIDRINEILLQSFEENFVTGHIDNPIVPINPRFQLNKGYLETTSDTVFLKRPLALMELFHILQKMPEIKGVRADTVRLVRIHRALIDEKYRRDIRVRSLFMDILRQPRGVSTALRRMNRYGILARFIPAFSKVVGRMQFDLFHIYTVDEHTLMVVRNLRRAACEEYSHEYPFAYELMSTQIPKPELLYIAGLFHDIAKGRGGDHSELGEVDARRFCQLQGLSHADTELVAWLVKSHLVMSTIAQRKDISDPDVIHEFAEFVGTETNLTYLFLLTVGDIRGTNPALFTNWRRSLLQQLYLSTASALQRGLSNRVKEQELIDSKRRLALYMLSSNGMAEEQAEEIWESFDDEYFMRDSAEEIAWHTQALVNYQHNPRNIGPLVLIRHFANLGTTVFLYTQDRDHLFGATAEALDNQGLDILDARIRSSSDGMTLNSFVITEGDGSGITNPYRELEVTKAVSTALERLADRGKHVLAPRKSLTGRRERTFKTPTVVSFVTDEAHSRTALELVATDRPGLLASVSTVLERFDLKLLQAKIATLGARAEDVFFVTTAEGTPIKGYDLQRDIRIALRRSLDSNQ